MKLKIIRKRIMMKNLLKKKLLEEITRKLEKLLNKKKKETDLLIIENFPCIVVYKSTIFFSPRRLFIVVSGGIYFDIRSGPSTRSSASQIVLLPTLFGPTIRVCPSKCSSALLMLRKFVIFSRTTFILVRPLVGVFAIRA